MKATGAGIAAPACDVDWSQPWLSHVAGIGRSVGGDWASGLSVHAALNAGMAAMGATAAMAAADALHGSAAPVRFVAQDALVPGQAYEQFIFDTASVPTRDHLHDLFNGLAWLHFPGTKRRLNQLQAAEIAERGVQPVRGPVRDSLTLFDENGAVLVAPAGLWDALIARDWRALFVDRRALWDEARLVVFGHALMEQLVQPRKPITAHVYLGRPPLAAVTLDGAEGLPALDAWLAAHLDPATLADKPFTPLPVLGVPGWWPGNSNFSFYDDSFVFRPRR